MKQNKLRACIVDHNEDQLRFIQTALIETHSVHAFNNVDMLKTWIARHRVDIFILDYTSLQESFTATIDRIRSDPKNFNAIIFFIIPKDHINELTEALKVGADDALFRPFDFKELLARVAARERDRKLFLKIERKISIGAYVLNLDSRTLKCSGKTVHLSHKQIEILKYLFNNCDQMLTRQSIFDKVWPKGTSQPDQQHLRTVDSHIRLLRKAIPSLKDDIKTVYGKGYEFITKRKTLS